MSFPKLTQKQIIRSLLSLLSSIAIIGLIAISVNLYKDTSAEERNNTQNITYDVCFTPNPDCLSLIIRQIEKAKKSIRVQAYSFTDPLIGESLVKAKQRGIDIKIILGEHSTGLHPWYLGRAEHKLRLPQIFLTLIFNILLNNSLVYTHC